MKSFEGNNKQIKFSLYLIDWKLLSVINTVWRHDSNFTELK